MNTLCKGCCVAATCAPCFTTASLSVKKTEGRVAGSRPTSRILLKMSVNVSFNLITVSVAMLRGGSVVPRPLSTEIIAAGMRQDPEDVAQRA